LGLGYPGGPAIAAAAAKYKIQDTRYKIQLPRPMIYTKDYDFSFSGLKTAVLYKVKQLKTINPVRNFQFLNGVNYKLKTEFCAEVQQAIIDVLIRNTLKAAKDFSAKAIILGGGVVANDELRRQFKEKIQKEIPDTKYLIPDTKYCTDNAAMVAATAYFHRKEKANLQKIKADANLQV
jgi:N6-L-threonylcarbamoyladenine synthase